MFSVLKREVMINQVNKYISLEFQGRNISVWPGFVLGIYVHICLKEYIHDWRNASIAVYFLLLKRRRDEIALSLED